MASSRYTIFRMDLSDGTTKIIKHVATQEEAVRKTAAFKRLAKKLSAVDLKAGEEWRYFWVANDLG